MGVDIDSQEMTSAILNGLPSQSECIITTLDALGQKSEVFTLDIVKSRLFQEGQCRIMREESREAAPIATSSHARHFVADKLQFAHIFSAEATEKRNARINIHS